MINSYKITNMTAEVELSILDKLNAIQERLGFVEGKIDFVEDRINLVHSDIKELRAELREHKEEMRYFKVDMIDFQKETKTEFALVHTELARLNKKIDEKEIRWGGWMFAAMTACASAIATLIGRFFLNFQK